jgi:hypothetical protein
MNKHSKYKKIILLTFALFAIMGSLTSCIIIPVYKWYEIDSETVASIQIYDLYDANTYMEAFLKTEVPVYEIPEEDKDTFLTELGKITFDDPIVIILASQQPRRSYGRWTVRVNYTDGSYQLISNEGFGQTFDENNECLESHRGLCDDEIWYEFIENYVPKDIFDRTQKETESNT